jgi:hypothetical protein
MKAEWSEQRVELPPGACANCGGEGQEQWIDGAGEPAACTCTGCRGTGNATNADNQQIAAALDAVNSWIANNPTGDHGAVIRDALREVLATRSWTDTTQKALREIDRLCQKEIDDPHNDFGDVGGTLEQCQKLARGSLTGRISASAAKPSGTETTLASAVRVEEIMPGYVRLYIGDLGVADFSPKNQYADVSAHSVTSSEYANEVAEALRHAIRNYGCSP